MQPTVVNVTNTNSESGGVIYMLVPHLGGAVDILEN